MRPSGQVRVDKYSGLEKSAAIRPFATKKSRLASETFLLADSLATESCRLADRLATKLFSRRTTPMRTERDRARCVAVFVGPRCKGVGRSSIVFASKSTPGSRRLPCQILLSRPSELRGRRKYRTRCDCQFARHISHPHESLSVRV